MFVVKPNKQSGGSLERNISDMMVNPDIFRCHDGKFVVVYLKCCMSFFGHTGAVLLHVRGPDVYQTVRPGRDSGMSLRYAVL